MYKVGAITVGQSPRLDVTADMIPFLGDNIQFIEKGALDGLCHADIEKFSPADGDYVLTSKMRDGTEVKFSERHILPLLQNCIEALERQNVDAIVFLCTGIFPKFNAAVPLIFPNAMLRSIVPALAFRGKIAVLTPSVEQIRQSVCKWEGLVETVIPVAASPYQDAFKAIDAAAEQLAAMDVDLVVMDCMGYSREMKCRLKEKTGKRILLPRTVAARLLRELLD